MAQITHGVWSILSYPLFYSLLQSIMGARRSRKKFVAEKIKPFKGMNVLDVGCGPAEILNYLPDINYWGFDVSENYIAHARSKFKARGNFKCKELQETDIENLPKFDVVLALGLLHHLDENEAQNIMRLASKALKFGGKLLTIDPCFEPSQNLFAKFLIDNDRGQNVRDKNGYKNIALSVFNDVLVEVRHQNWIPYTNCFMECKKF